MSPPFGRQHGQVSRGGGMFQNRWGIVSEKVPLSWGNDSEKSHAEWLAPGCEVSAETLLAAAEAHRGAARSIRDTSPSAHRPMPCASPARGTRGHLLGSQFVVRRRRYLALVGEV